MMKFSSLSSYHNSTAFSCGAPVLDSYLKERATQDIKRGICAVHVLDENDTIIGFYTLSSYTLQLTDLPAAIARKYPRNLLLPCWLIGRLAVDLQFQGKRIGETLLMDALRRVTELAKNAGGYCVVVDAKDETVKPFYAKYGFKPIQDDSLRMYLPLSMISV
jgi:predicted GNAT family N-acyltransferase